MSQIQTIQSLRMSWTEFLYTNVAMAPLWFVVRLYVGGVWLHASWEKLHSPLWVGSQAGVAVKGFLMGALQKTSGEHPDVQGWYAYFVEHFALQHTVLFSYLVTFGELFVGIALILGLFTATAAFFGAFMNMNYLLAGTVSINPILLILEILLIAAWRIAGWWGLDRYVLPKLFHPAPEKP
jgi:thiosulfate dehydrogenase [quinone] large subunit